MIRTWTLALLLLAGCGSDLVAIKDFDVSASLASAPSTLVTETGRWDGCRTTWTFTANDSHPTIYYSVGPALVAGHSEWWENGNFRNRGQVSLFAPMGREIAYALWRVEGTTEVWRKESGRRQVSC